MLWEMMNDTERVKRISEKGDFKGINQEWINSFYDSVSRKVIFDRIREGTYKIFPPHIGLIPKENGEFRQVYINEDLDRILLMVINDCLFDAFPEMIHPNCVSYQKGIGTQKIIKEISEVLTKIEENSTYKGKSPKRIGVKMDFSKYFDNVKIESIDGILEKLKSKLPKDEWCVIDFISKYYHQDEYFDLDGKLQRNYQGLKQGCAVASFLACVIPYEYDEYMSKKYKIYYRYSDDVLVLDKYNHAVEKETALMMAKYGVSLNPKKVESIYINKWFKFLGFELKGSKITLSESRFEKFESTVLDLTKNKSRKKAFKDLVYWLYCGEHSWASSCLNTINCECDIAEMEKFIKDAINTSESEYRYLGKLHSNLTGKDGILFRAKGKDCGRSKRRWIEGYYSIFAMRNARSFSEELYEAMGREMMRNDAL